MKLGEHIRIFVLTLAFTGLGVTASNASSLTADERHVCSTLRVCVDIIRRHDASEFDYEVLGSEFQRFGAAGRKALMDVLDSPAGNPAIAEMIFAAMPLNDSERLALKKKWSLDLAEIYLPFLLDGHPLSRDLLLLSLGSDNPSVREQARLGLNDLPEPVREKYLPQNLRQPLLAALARDPISEVAPYIAKLNPDGLEDGFAHLLLSGEFELVLAAYEALYRQNPSNAFRALLAQMESIASPAQAGAIGDMLLLRHENRPDGFYLKFAEDMSGDQFRSVSARASALHAILLSETSEMPELTPARAEALKFLVNGQPIVTQDKYIPYLKRLKSEKELNLIWDIATEERWINRDRISEAFAGLKSHDKIIGDLIQSSDFRSFSAGVAQSKANPQARKSHIALLRKRRNYPIQAIRDLARKTLRLPTAASYVPCTISKFDAEDRLNQMPFFDLAWMKTVNNTRIVLDRKYLTSAHPSQTGWLAGYDLQKSTLKSAHAGAALIYFDNKTGEFEQVGDFSGPVAILPDRLLKLGESTNRFWVIDRWSGDSSDVSAYSVDLTKDVPRIRHLGAIPNMIRDVSVAPNGDLLLEFEGGKQAPLRMSSQGDISLACRSLQPVTAAPAPN